MTLRTRVGALEAAVPAVLQPFCQVIHGENCAQDRADAIAAFEAKHGFEPEHFIERVIVEADGASVCGCPTNHPIRTQA